MAEAKGIRKAGAEEPKVAWTKAYTPWGVPCSMMLVDGRTQACRDPFGTPIPITQFEKSTMRED